MREESDGKQPLIIAGTAGRDAIPPSSELSDDGAWSPVEDPEDDAYRRRLSCYCCKVAVATKPDPAEPEP